ncbi:MAG: N-acetyl-gamma-glutamyl-phosphate reductase [Acidobacteriaceae bacterium]
MMHHTPVQSGAVQSGAVQTAAVQTAVMGVSGYAGAELARLLLQHPCLKAAPPLFFSREGSAPKQLASLHPQLTGMANGAASPLIEPFDPATLAARGVEVLFLATPHEQSRSYAPQALHAGIKVIDLSGAWRLTESRNRAVYQFEDEDCDCVAHTQAQAVYGLPELHRAAIADADLVANPGCYATSIILALKPLLAAGLVDLEHGIVCDAKSGVSGAGKTPTAKTHFMYAADNLSAYSLFGHRHTGELLEQLGLTDDAIVFTPHLLPIPRGILSTIYLRLRERTAAEQVEGCLRHFYRESPLVRVYPAGQLPQLQWSVRTSFADIGFELNADGRRCVLVSCLDNLLKGAAARAVQNLNLMCGWNETEGLL